MSIWKSSNNKRGRRPHDHCLLSPNTSVFNVKPQCNNYFKYCICSTEKFGVFGVHQIYNPTKMIMPWNILQRREKETKVVIVRVVVLRAKANKKTKKEILKLGDLSFDSWNISPNTCKSTRCDLLTRKTKYYFIFNTKH